MESKIKSNSVCEVSLLFTNDAEIHKINLEYRNKDKPTDVISFATIDSKIKNPLEISLGDIVISIDTLIKQSKKYKVTKEQELLRLLVHGTLHLLGFDHENVTKNKAAEMMRLQRKVIKDFNKQKLILKNLF